VLRSINPLLNADVLYALRAIGHGDRLVVCDTNFPADSIARQTVLGRLLRIDNVSAAKAIEAIPSVLPQDTFVDDAAIRTEIVGQPQELPPVPSSAKRQRRPGVIATGERRFYGCFLFSKGVIGPDGER
jgi:L-fucose mutarotase